MKRNLFSLLLILPLSIFAQTWTTNLNKRNLTLEDVQSAFAEHWKNKPIEKGKGYKQFKRWEWFMSTRIMPDGSLPSADITVKNYTEYLQRQGSPANNRISAAANWVSNGPNTSPGGYNGLGRINCIAFHPTNANTFWVGTPAGGLWKTTNGGSTWTTVTDNLPVLGVSDIAIDPANPNIMYIATGDGEGSYSLTSNSTYAGDTKSIGVLKSTDGGNTWNTTGLSWTVTAAKLIRRLLINPVNPQLLIAATSDGIYQTTNAGVAWTQVQSGYFMDAEFKPGDPTIVYAATKKTTTAATQIYRSTNSGNTWTSVATLAGVLRANLAVSPHLSTLVDVLACDEEEGLAGLWYSNNSGASFTRYFTGTNSNNMLNWSYNASGSGGQGTYDLAYAINPTNSDEIWLGGINTWKSTDGGSNWSIKNMWTGYTGDNPNNVPVVHADKHFIAFHPLTPGTIFECNDGGLYKSTNGGNTWTDLSNGLTISQLYSIGTSATVANNVIMGLQDNGTKEIYNNTYFERTGGDGMECIIDYTDANIMYSSYVNGMIYKTTNGFTSSTTIVDNDGTGVNESGAWLTPYIMHPTNNLTLLVGKTQVYQTTNGGNTWSQLGTISGAVGKIIRLAYAPSNPQIIYAATRTQIFKTSNGGTSWVRLNGTTSTAAPNTYIAVHSTNPDLLFVTHGGYVSNDKVWSVTSTNAPTTSWENLSGNLPNLPVNCIVYQNGSNNGIFIGTDVGVYYRNATSNDWVAFDTGLPKVVVTELEISYNNKKLWAATFGRGLWSTDLCYINASSAGSTTFCEGGSVTLNSSESTGNQWYKNNVAISGATNPTYQATTSGTYAVSSSAWSFCSTVQSNTVVVTVNPLPAASISAAGPTTLCTGGSVVLNANTGTGLNYQWKKDGTNISGATASSYTTNSSGVYTVLVTNSLNCNSTSNALTVTTISTPSAPVASTSGSTTFCQGGSVTLTSSATTGNQWYNNGTLISGATGQNYIAVATGLYAVNSTSGTCSSTLSNSVSVTVNPLPTASITAGGSTAFCTGATGVVLNATAGAGLNYQWKKDGINISGATAAAYTATVSGSYSVAVSNSSNCTNISSAIQVTSNPIPSTPSISWNGTQLTTTATGVSFQWYLNGALIPGATSVSHTPAAIGTYKVVVTANGCSNSSDNYTLVVTFAGGYLANPSNIAEVYPNPAQSNFVIKFNQTPELTLDVQLINEAGNILKTIRTKNKTTSVNVSHLPSGTYWIKINGGEFSQVKKIVITK